MILLTLSSSWASAEVLLRAPKNIAELLTPFLPKEAGSPPKLETLLGGILATEGYFSPNFEFSESEGAETTQQISVDPGPQTRIANVDLSITGSLDEAARQTLINAWLLPVGQTFRQADWTRAKQQVLSELLARDYAAAKLADSTALIRADDEQADLSAHYQTGPRYRFGELVVDGLQRYTPDLVQRYNTDVRLGEPYQEKSLSALQSRLQSSPYFSAVQVSLEQEEATSVNDDGSVSAPVRVLVRERPLHRLSFGAGASSNTGLRTEVNYQTIALFGEPWQLISGLRIEQKQQTAYADVFFPPDDKNRNNSLGFLLENSNIEDLKTQRYAFGAQTIQMRGSVEQRLSLNWQQERSTPSGADEMRSKALVPAAMWTWRRIDNLLDPRDGIALQAQIGAASKWALSDQNFVRFYGRYQQFIPLGARNTLALRAEGGYTAAPSRTGIPQDYLFRTGGANSVRGYAYQSLGVADGSAVVGGRYLAILSGEVTHWINEQWGAAAFVDAGNAVDDLANLNLALGYGLGARWRSPAGPIGLDLAYGQRDARFQLHFSLAIPF